MYATDDVMDENDVASPFIEKCLEVDPDAVTPVPDIEAAIQKWIGTLVIGGADQSRVMAGIKSRWQYGRKRVAGNPNPVRGLVGVRVRAS